MGYLDFIDLVLSEELAVRDDRRFRQGLRLSRLPHHKTLDDYDFSFQPELDPRKVKDLTTLSFVEAKANAALLGPPGVGKTHIAVALTVAACRAGYSIYFTSLDDMVRNLSTAEAAGRLTNKLGTYLRPAVLVLDEVGYQPLARAEANLVFQVISKRYEKGSIILTSNKTFSEWGQVFGDEVFNGVRRQAAVSARAVYLVAADVVRPWRGRPPSGRGNADPVPDLDHPHPPDRT